jgi:predicted DNA-binding transcriptional regulator YafY
MDPVTVLALLRDAADRRQPVWIGYADASGEPSRRFVQPVHVEAGKVNAFDRVSQEMRTFSIHRVTAVAVITH